MPDPNEYPVTGGGLPREDAPQQPQQTQYGYQQPQQPQQTQYGYQQTQQSQYGYQQTRQPQYGYQQAQQTQYGYQQTRQPQYGYQQARQTQYGYQQQYGCQQPYPQQPYGYRQSSPVPAVTHKKAIGSMILMILALSFLAYPLFLYIRNNIDSAIHYGSGYAWIYLLGYFCLLTGLTLMLVGAIIGSRGSVLFGVGLLLLLVFQFEVRVLSFFLDTYVHYEIRLIQLLLGLVLITGTVLAAIGCLARVKALKIVGGILMLVFFVLAYILEVGYWISMAGIQYLRVDTLLYFLGFLLVCVAVLLFPIRRVRASA